MDEIISEIYTLVKKKMREQAAFTREAYNEVVDETIEYFLEKGKITDDDNLELMKNELNDLYESAEDSLADEDEQNFY